MFTWIVGFVIWVALVALILLFFKGSSKIDDDYEMAMDQLVKEFKKKL